MSLKIKTAFTPRRPQLIRVWRPTGLPGSPLTSSWLLPTASNADSTAKGGLRP